MEVAEGDVSRGENVIYLHVAYKLKVDERGPMKLKNRIGPHGNCDMQKDDVQKDSATAQFDVIRLALSMSTRMNAVLDHADIKGAYIQSGRIKTKMYERPQREMKAECWTLWMLTMLSYEIEE